MDDLLKEAIADAKAVRETALENAKIALEEAFTPRLQSMLSKKIQSETELEGAHEDDEDVDERMHDEDEEEVDEKMRLKADDEDPTDKDSNEAMHDEDEDDVEERMHGEEEDDDVEERMHDEDEDDVEERMHGEEEDDDVDEELDLEAVLKELENEAMHDEDEDDDKKDEAMHDEDEEDKVDENDVSSGIGSADNKVDKKAGDSTDIGKAGKAKFESKEQVEEDIDLDEVLKALTEDDEEEVAEEVNEVEKLQSELDEHRDVVKYLRGKLNEVNLLNAKLLFTNKLFRAYGLSNDQKMKVVETFDRATNLREVKLVYSTLAESFGVNTKKEIKESKGSASKAVASTKSEKQEIISEGSELRDRFKKLAGITKFSI
jgi:sulfur relay (sulfurtransferase) DsrC/TusE family protein